MMEPSSCWLMLLTLLASASGTNNFLYCCVQSLQIAAVLLFIQFLRTILRERREESMKEAKSFLHRGGIHHPRILTQPAKMPQHTSLAGC
eukprot:3241478-Pleurochrysis_carterae.AAC.2